MSTSLMKIGELAKRTSKTIRALHHYEALDLLAPAHRTKGGFRLYDRSNLERIEYIDRLQRLGLSLAQIKELVDDWQSGETPAAAMERLKASYRTRLADVRRRLDDLKALERELSDSLAFIEGCRTCAVEDEQPHDACGGCDRTHHEVTGGLTLITGLTTAH